MSATATKIKLTCPCLFGLESVLKGEILRLGLEVLEVTDGRVTFWGELSDIARANIQLRTAERVQILLGSFHAASFEELFQGVLALPFEAYIGRKDAFPVKGYSLNSKLHSVPDCQSIVKKAAAKRLGGKYGVEWLEESGPAVQIQFSILRDQVLILLDSSGMGLHKRGYRKDANEAPIKETLAAGIIDLSRMYDDTCFYDPFCGSGTFVIEGAMKALNIAPGLNRHFAAEQWGCIDPATWKTERERGLDEIKRTADFRGYGYDIDPTAIEICQINAKRAGVSPKLRFQVQDITDFQIPGERALVICNPPYGERLLDIRQAEQLYVAMGKVFAKRDQLRYSIISPHESFESFFGRPADKRRKLYNGMIRCQLFMYFRNQ